MKANHRLLSVAATHLGIRELPGHTHESRIVSMLRAVGIRRGGDETPWCAAFVNHCCFLSGLPGTKSAMARSFRTWGLGVMSLEFARPGDVVVLWRGSKRGPYGHVGLFLRAEGGHIWLLGGNQGNMVRASRYPAYRVLAVRRGRP